MSEQPSTPAREPSRPWLCWSLLVLNVLVWLAMVVAGVDPIHPNAERLLAWGGNLGLVTIQGQWWRLLSAMFLHAGLLHLGFNGYFLWAVGRVTEQVFGPAAFALIYLGSGLIASTVSLLWQPDVVSVGASGALFGVFGAFLGFTLRRREVLPAAFVKQVYRNAAFLIGINLVIGLGVEGIDLAAHLGGLIAGVGIGWLLAKLAERAPRDAEDRQAIRRRAIGLTTLATAGVLAIGVLAVPRWDDAYGTIERYEQLHAEAVGAYLAAEDSPARERVLREQAIPAMHELEAMLVELDRVPESMQPRIAELIEYTQVRRTAFELELDALAGGDPRKFGEAETLHRRARELFDGAE
ncbi:rhomboid family intramembrane serine protease [Nannocystaceae bacterium ST9]